MADAPDMARGARRARSRTRDRPRAQRERGAALVEFAIVMPILFLVVFGADTDPFGEEVPTDLFDIQLTPRFAYVPQFVQAVPPTGSSSNLNIAAFRAIFMEDVYAGCAGGSCNVSFSPGPWNTGSQGASNLKAAAMTAWVFPPSMLPVGLRGNPAAVGQNTYIQLVD